MFLLLFWTSYKVLFLLQLYSTGSVPCWSNHFTLVLCLTWSHLLEGLLPSQPVISLLCSTSCPLLSCPIDVDPVFHPEVHLNFKTLLQAFLHQLQLPSSPHHTQLITESNRNGEKNNTSAFRCHRCALLWSRNSMGFNHELLTRGIGESTGEETWSLWRQTEERGKIKKRAFFFRLICTEE